MGVTLFGKNIMQIYMHHIMQIDYETVQRTIKDRSTVILRKISTEDIAHELEPVGTTVSIGNIKRLIRRNGTKCEGFILEEMGGYSVGTIWVLYKGSNDLEYKIRNTEAYIFDVYVNEAHR